MPCDVVAWWDENLRSPCGVPKHLVVAIHPNPVHVQVLVLNSVGISGARNGRQMALHVFLAQYSATWVPSHSI